MGLFAAGLQWYDKKTTTDCFGSSYEMYNDDPFEAKRSRSGQKKNWFRSQILVEKLVSAGDAALFKK